MQTAGKLLSGKDQGLVTIPTLVMARSEGPVFLRDAAHALAEVLSHARLLTQKGRGDFMQQENANESNALRRTKVLLACGVASGPLFYIVAVIQMFTRSGFDIRHHAISLLSLGNLGWIQITNFILTGVLAILCAVGMRWVLHPGRGETWGPLLIGIYGVGLIVGGIFHPDPGLGFPPGAPAGMPTTMSWHAVLHSIFFYTAFLALIVDSFVFVRRFLSQGRREWGIYCAATGVVSPLLIVLGTSITSLAGVLFAIAGVVAFGWVSVMAARLFAELSEGGPVGQQVSWATK